MDGKYNFKLYLLDDFAGFQEILPFLSCIMRSGIVQTGFACRKVRFTGKRGHIQNAAINMIRDGEKEIFPRKISLVK